MQGLLEKIISAGLITPEQAKSAAGEAARINRSIWAAMIKLEYISEEHLSRFFAEEAHIPYVHLPDYRIKRSALEMLDEHFCKANTVIPLCRVSDTLFLACNNPFNAALMDTIGKLTGCIVEPLIASPAGILQALDYYWHDSFINYDIADFLIRQEPVKGVAFWRGAERIPIDWAVELYVRDDGFSLAVAPYIDGRARDISGDGRAMGITSTLYLPPGIRVLVAVLPQSGQSAVYERLELAGEIVHSFMQDTRRFAIGIRLTDIDAHVKQQLLKRIGMSRGMGV